MFYNIDQFPFLNNFIGQEDNILNELFDAKKNNSNVLNILSPNDKGQVDHYVQWWIRDNGFHKEQTGIDIRENIEEYYVLAVWKKDFSIKHFDAPKLFPKLLALTETVPNRHLSALIKSDSQSVLHTHTHTRKQLVFHLLLNDLEDGFYEITVGGEPRRMSKKGDWLIFDYSYPHSAINTSKTCRYGLIVDFNPF